MTSKEDFNNNVFSSTITFSVPTDFLHAAINSPYKLSTQPDFYVYVIAVFPYKLYVLAAAASSALILASASSVLAP